MSLLAQLKKDSLLARKAADSVRATLLSTLIAEAEKLWPHSSSVIALTLRVETPCTCISASAATRACSLRW